MLLPMNYAVLIGGMATTIGTSTNLIVVAIAAGLGVGPFSLFGFFPLVALAAIPGLAYLWLLAPTLLTGVESPQEHLSDDAFDAELHVEADSWLDGRQLREAFEATKHRLQLRAVVRRGNKVTPLPSVVLRADDRLVVRDTAANLKEIESAVKAKLHGSAAPSADADSEAAARGDAKPATKGTTPMDRAARARPLGRGRAAHRHARIAAGRALGAAACGSPSATASSWSGLRPRAASMPRWQRQDLADRSLDGRRHPAGAGRGRRRCARRSATASACCSTSASRCRARTRRCWRWPRWRSSWCWRPPSSLPISLAALGGVLVLLSRRAACRGRTRRGAVGQGRAAGAASLALGDALAGHRRHRLAGGAAGRASSGSAPRGGGHAADGADGAGDQLRLEQRRRRHRHAARRRPGADRSGLPPEPFVLAVLFGCNLCYLTPMGYQTNLLVMNAAGYRFGDFLRVGTPLFLIMWAGLSFAAGLALRSVTSGVHPRSGNSTALPGLPRCRSRSRDACSPGRLRSA